MKRHRPSIRFMIGALGLMLVVVYAVICLSPLKPAMGRQRPALASLFSPPWFNFEAAYTDGDILSFRVGMSRAQLIQTIERRYAANGVLQGYCGDPQQKQRLPTLVRIDSGQAYRVLIARDVVCLWIGDSRLSLIFFLKADVVNRIEIALVRNEVL